MCFVALKRLAQRNKDWNGRRTHHEGREGPSAAEPQPRLGVSRAKAQRSQRIKLPDLACLASWREQIPVSRATGRKFAQAAKTLNHSSTKQGGFETRPYIFLRALRVDFSYFVFFGYFVVKICRFIRILSCVYANLTYNQERCSLFKRRCSWELIF